MAVPKKKVSRGRRDRRRYHPSNLLDSVTVSICPGCGEPVRPHRLCSTKSDCLHYYKARTEKSSTASATK